MGGPAQKMFKIGNPETHFPKSEETMGESRGHDPGPLVLAPVGSIFQQKLNATLKNMLVGAYLQVCTSKPVRSTGKSQTKDCSRMMKMEFPDLRALQ